jgi:tetrahydromethanopterin S-methyltransferase subunit G
MSGRGGRAAGIFLTLTLSAMALVFLAFLMDGLTRNHPEAMIPGGIALAGLTWLFARGPLGIAIARLLEGEADATPVSSARFAELESRLAELEHRGLTSGEVEQAYVRLAEMEERVDFAERLLARREEGSAGPPDGAVR